MSRVLGIDLGTTNSCVAVMDREGPAVIANAEGARTTPSVVAFAASGERIVGQSARRQAMTNAENTVYAVKRLMGRKFDDPEVQRHLLTSPYEVVAAKNGDAHVRVRGRDHAPPEISALVLAKMRETAEQWLGEPVTEAVVTVPAYFDDAQRQATRDAGRIAGLDILRIVNEPTAAALAYGVEIETAQRVAVYDLGGGTFDVSILELSEGVFRVCSTSGDTFLGGEDFDNLLVEHLIAAFAEQHGGVDLRRDRMALQRLKEAAERAKIELSSSLETEINLPFIAASAEGPMHLQLAYTRRELEALVEPLVQKTRAPCLLALEDAGVTARDIDVVILVGGQTRMPRVQALVQEIFGKEPSRRVNPDEVVAVGAAIQAGVLTGEVQEVLLLDVTPLTLGIETAGGVFTRLIPRNTAVPAHASEMFTTVIDNQPFVNVHVLQGEREMAADNRSLANFELAGIPAAPRGAPKIEVSFDLDADGILTVSAHDHGTGVAQQVTVTPSSGLSERDISALVEESAAMSGADSQRRAVAEAKTKAEGLIYSSERSLAEFGDKLPPAMATQSAKELEAYRKGLESADPGVVFAALAGLEVLAKYIGDSIFDAFEKKKAKPDQGF